MALTRIARCVYSVNGDDLTLSVYSSPVVAVHPYYKSGMHINGISGLWSFFGNVQGHLQIDKKDPYIEQFEHLVRDLKRPVITFEEAYKAELTAERYRHLGRSERTYFIKTRPNAVRPKGISVPHIWTPWDDIASFLVAFKQPIDLVGGRYDEQNPEHWCLGAVAHFLKDAGLPFRILKEVTF